MKNEKRIIYNKQIQKRIKKQKIFFAFLLYEIFVKTIEKIKKECII